jgi:hypothetical protein
MSATLWCMPEIFHLMLCGEDCKKVYVVIVLYVSRLDTRHPSVGSFRGPSSGRLGSGWKPFV